MGGDDARTSDDYVNISFICCASSLKRSQVYQPYIPSPAHVLLPSYGELAVTHDAWKYQQKGTYVSSSNDSDASEARTATDVPLSPPHTVTYVRSHLLWLYLMLTHV